MTKAGDSILVTPGSGATIATHTVSAKEHEVWMAADAAGNLRDDQLGLWGVGTWNEGGTDGFSSTERARISLLNTSTTLVVDVLHVYALYMNEASASARIGTRARLRRSTAHSAGSLMTPNKLDSSSGALDAAITVRHGTDSNVLSVTGTGEELSSVFLLASETSMHQRVSVWSWRSEGVPIVLRQDEGVYVRDQSESNNASVSHPQYGLVFRVR